MMYAICGRLREVQTLFDEILDGNLWAWNALIPMYSQMGLHYEAI